MTISVENHKIGNVHARYHVNPSGGCKIITHLESQTPTFLLTVQLSLGYDDN